MSNINNVERDTDQLDEFDLEQVELKVRPREFEVVRLQLPKTVLASLGRVVARRSMSSVEALIRFYVGRGLRQDLGEMFSERMMAATAEVLARRLGSEDAAAEAMEEIREVVAGSAEGE